MSEDRWNAVDAYVAGLLAPADAVLHAAQEASVAAELPTISVSPLQGKFLHLLARLQHARAILEIGTLAGYSTIWLARALPPGGRVVTLEAEPHHAEVARANIARAGLAQVVDIRVGAALDTLPQIAAERSGPFDFIFIDADKPNTPAYFRWALALSRPGTLIVVDNVVRNGALAEPGSTDPSVLGMRQLTELLAGEPRVSATILQTVGGKGYDGFAIAIVGDEGEGDGR